MPFLPNRVVPVSTQCLVCSTALLVYALAGLAITIVLTFELPPPGFEAEAEVRVHIRMGVVAVCAASGLLGVLATVLRASGVG
jgi:hypothetical protein